MSAVLFDTHEAVKELQDAGVEPAAAEAVVRTIRRGLGENVATKQDIVELRSELKADIATLEARLTWRLLGGFAVLLSIAVALLKFI